MFHSNKNNYNPASFPAVIQCGRMVLELQNICPNRAIKIIL